MPVYSPALKLFNLRLVRSLMAVVHFNILLFYATAARFTFVSLNRSYHLDFSLRNCLGEFKIELSLRSSGVPIIFSFTSCAHFDRKEPCCATHEVPLPAFCYCSAVKHAPKSIRSGQIAQYGVDE